MISCWAMGLTQHKNSVATIQEISNLHLIGGNIGKPGAGVCPVRGHSNVQGDRTVGINEKASEEFISSLENTFKITLPQEHGYSVVEAIEAMRLGKVKFYFAMGGNLLSAAPDTEITAQAMQKCDLTVFITTKLNRGHLLIGKESLILPCLARSEIDLQNEVAQYVSVENSMGIVHASEGKLQPCSKKLKSEVAIVCELAAKIHGNSPVNWKNFCGDYNLIRDTIEKVLPEFHNYNQRVSRGFYLPNPPRDKRGISNK